MDRRRLWSLWAAATAMLLGAGCGKVAGSADIARSTGPHESAAAAPGGDGPKTDRPVSPIEFYFQGGLTSAEAHRSIEVLVVTCMAELGLEYDAVPYVDDEPLTRDALVAFRAAHGFGVTDREASTFSASTDPNQDRLRSMTEQDRLAYLDALEGPERETSMGGCRRKAVGEVYSTIPAFSLSRAEKDQIVALVEDDPAVQEGRSAYLDCMAAAGIPVTTPETAAYEWGEHRIAVNDPTPEQQAAERSAELADAAIELACQKRYLWDAWAAHDTEVRLAVDAALAKG